MKTKKIKRTNPVKTEQYEVAFKKFINDESADFEIKESWENGPMIVSYKNKIYRVDSANDMYNHVKNLLTDKESAIMVSLWHWIEVAEYVHVEEDFINTLVNKLNSREEIENLNYAINFSNHTSNSPSVFWNTIQSIDNFELYPKAILAACETYDLECMIDELLSLMVTYGESKFNELNDGIFESVDIYKDDEEDLSSDDGLFYIYTVDPISWE